MRIGKKVWHSMRINNPNDEIGEYAPPVCYVTHTNYLTVMPATSRGFMAMMQYGEDIENTWTVIANGRAFEGVFGKGDLMWVDDENPPSEDELTEIFGYAQSATAIVKSAVEVNLTISVTLTRNKDQVKK